MNSPATRVIAEECDDPIPPRRINLATVDEVRVEMARVYREMRSGKLDPSLGGKLVWVLATLAKVTDASLNERRLIELEDQLKRLGYDKN